MIAVIMKIVLWVGGGAGHAGRLRLQRPGGELINVYIYIYIYIYV